VKPDDRVCSYCEAGLDEEVMKSTTLCPKCFTRIADNARHCSGCGIEIRPQALTPIPHDRSCPRCKGDLQIRALGISDVIECVSCQGIWVRSGAFESICRDAVLNGAVPLPDWPKQAEPAAPGGPFYIPCLQCERLMQRRQFRHNQRSIGVIIDVCRTHGVWLDHRELERITQHIRETGGALEPLFAKEKLPEHKLVLSEPSATAPRSLLEAALDFVIESIRR
jgi:Zn-finger nucleic acid-binding protein